MLRPVPDAGGAAPVVTGSAPALVISGLVKHFGEKHAVDGVDLTVASGSFCAEPTAKHRLSTPLSRKARWVE